MKSFPFKTRANFIPNFYNVSDSIPHGSNVVFVFCEIDCREGILVAAKKIDIRMLMLELHVVALYGGIGRIDCKEKFKAFIHPVSQSISIIYTCS